MESELGESEPVEGEREGLNKQADKAGNQPIPTSTESNNQSIASFTDEYSQYTTIHLMVEKPRIDGGAGHKTTVTPRIDENAITTQQDWQMAPEMAEEDAARMAE